MLSSVDIWRTGTRCTTHTCAKTFVNGPQSVTIFQCSFMLHRRDAIRIDKHKRHTHDRSTGQFGSRPPDFSLPILSTTKVYLCTYTVCSIYRDRNEYINMKYIIFLLNLNIEKNEYQLQHASDDDPVLCVRAAGGISTDVRTSVRNSHRA